MKKASSVEDYLAELPGDSRATLENVRAAIRAAAPEAEEKIAYGMPGFYIGGHPLVYYAAFKAHCSFFPASGTVVDSFADELAGYDVAKGTIRFPIGEPPPATLIRKIVKARMKEQAARHYR
ncbi:MAG: iron chaperone [Actinomycetota bacterium]|nr:DUF1801 domain-containing protein [Actinomycetota bacterium]